MRTLFVLYRKSGVKSNADRGISSAHCPNCGGPETSSASNACEFCGTVLNDGSLGWVLADVMPARGEAADALWQGRRPAADGNGNGRAPSTPSSEGLLTWLVKTSVSDREVSDRERARLGKMAAKAGVSSDRLESLIDAAENGRLETPEPADVQEARAWLTEMAATALMDGRITSQEAQLLRAVGGRVGLVDEDIRMILKQQQAKMYADAQEAMRRGGGNGNGG
jgi:hypothetical protein